MCPSSQSPVTPSSSLVVSCRHPSPLQLHPINVDAAAAQSTISSPAKRAVSEERRRRPANYNLFKSTNSKNQAELEYSCSHDDLTSQIGEEEAAAAAQASPLRCSASANGTNSGKKQYSSAMLPSPRRSDYSHALAAGSIRTTCTSPARLIARRSNSISAEMAGSGAAEPNSRMNDNKGRRPAVAGSENARPSSAERDSPKFAMSQNRWPRSLSILKLYGSGRTRMASNAKKQTPQDLDLPLRQAKPTSSIASSKVVVVPNRATAAAAAISSASPAGSACCCSDDMYSTHHANSSSSSSSVLRTFARKLNLDGVKQIKETLRRGTRISDLSTTTTGGYYDHSSSGSRVPVRAAAVAAASGKTTQILYCSRQQSMMSKREESGELQVSLMRSTFDVCSSSSSNNSSGASSSSITSSLLSPRVTTTYSAVTGTGGGGAGFSPSWGTKKHRRSQSELLLCGNNNKNNTCTTGGGAGNMKQQAPPPLLRRTSAPSAAVAWTSTPSPRASTSSDGGGITSISSTSRRAGSTSTPYAAAAAAWPTFHRNINNIIQLQYYSSSSSPRRAPPPPPLSPTSPAAPAASNSVSANSSSRIVVSSPMSPFHRTAAATTFLPPATSHYPDSTRKASRLMALPTVIDMDAVFLHRILHNRLLQWRFSNARAELANSIQCRTGEKLLLNVWARTAEIRRSVTTKRTILLQAKQAKKVGCIVRGQRSLLAVWPSIQQEHSNALSGIVHSLETCVSRIPIDGAVQADIHNVKGVVTSALSLMNALESSMHHLLAKAEKATELMSELAQVADRERALLGECRDLLFVASSLEVEERSLRAQLLQREQATNVWGRLIA